MAADSGQVLAAGLATREDLIDETFGHPLTSHLHSLLLALGYHVLLNLVSRELLEKVTCPVTLGLFVNVDRFHRVVWIDLESEARTVASLGWGCLPR